MNLIAKKASKGFTLIELLVVVAIIGILASIVLVSLNSARAKGRDASAKGSISSIRAAAEIYYDSKGGTYYVDASDNVCLDPGVLSLLNAAEDETAIAPQCNSAQLEYAVGATLNNGNIFCVDSTGFAGDFMNGNPIVAPASSADGDLACATS